VETTAYYAFGLPIYFLVVFIEAIAAKRRGHPVATFAPSFGNVGAGLGAIAVGLFLGPALLALYDWAFDRFALVHWPAGSLWVWLVAWVLADFGHYWHHRLDHRVAACWAIHGVHHQPTEMNFTVAMRHAWFSDLYSFPFYSLLPLAGVPSTHFFAVTTFLSFHALITHSAEYTFPSLGILVTPRSHILHHAKNPRYIDKNYAAMIGLWDRLFGTYVELDPSEPPVYGMIHGYETHDGALSQWVLVRDLLDLARRARTLGDKLRVFISRPGWVPPGVEREPAIEPPASEAIPIVTKLYVALQFVAAIVLSLWIFILRDQHSLATNLGGLAFIIVTLLTLGGLLDRRPGCVLHEVLRLAACAVAAASLAP
jgi:sterol desaturase/sphingolipid hydroxylase (fatty acid hydroxylase superfamily)